MVFFLPLCVINVLQAARAQWPILTLNHRVPSAHLNLRSTQHLNTNGTVYVANGPEKAHLVHLYKGFMGKMFLLYFLFLIHL